MNNIGMNDINPFLDFGIPKVLNNVDYLNFNYLFNSIYEEFINKRKESPIYLKTYLMQILANILKECNGYDCLKNPSRSISQNYTKIMDVRKFIENNVSLRFKIESLADMAGISPNFFIKIFKKIVGETPIVYINNLKINRAKKLLVETNKSVKEIAFECGFENESYFFTLFKKNEKFSPMEIRAASKYSFNINRSV